MREISFLYVTVPKRTLAESIGHTLVEERLAVCVNILGDIQSIYRWKGTLEQSHEVAMLIKTTNERVEAATGRIKALHPHECPAIASIPITGGFAPFLAWIGAETSS